MKRFAAGLLLASVLLAPSYAATAPATRARPALQVTTLGGKPFDLASRRGHWVIVNFWATWCVPCIQEMPAISHFVASHRNVDAIGLAYEDTAKADIVKFLARHPVSYPVAQVSVDDPPKDFAQPLGLPTTYLIAPDGSVAHRFVGPVTAQSLAAEIGGK